MMAMIMILFAAVAQAPMADAPAKLLSDPGLLIQRADYPAVALLDDLQGSTAFAIAVGANGKAERCRVTVSSGSEILDQATCKLVMERGRFQAAQSAGKMVSGEWKSRVRWRLDGGYVAVDPRFDGPARTSAAANQAFRSVVVTEAVERAGLDPAQKMTSFVILDIDRGGAVAGCRLDGGDADAARAKLACPLFVGKDVFTPGFDRDGNAVADRARVKIRW